MSLIPWAPSQWLDDLGRPLAFGRLYLYQAGTLIPKASYQDSAHTVAHTFPIVLDATGRANVWLTDGEAYDLVVHDADDNFTRSVLGILAGDGGGTPVPSSDSVASIESFPETEKDWFTDPDYEYFRDDGCFCWIVAAKNISRIKWFKTISGWNSTYPSGKVSIWGAMLPSFSDGVKLAEFILPDADYVGVQSLDLDTSAYRWIGVACDPGLVDSGVAIMQTGMLLPPDVVALAPRFSGYIGQHVHNATFDAFPMIYGLDPKYMMTRWMSLGVIYA